MGVCLYKCGGDVGGMSGQENEDLETMCKG